MIAFVSRRDLSGMHPIWKSYKAAGEKHVNNQGQILALPDYDK